ENRPGEILGTEGPSLETFGFMETTSNAVCAGKRSDVQNKPEAKQEVKVNFIKRRYISNNDIYRSVYSQGRIVIEVHVSFLICSLAFLSTGDEYVGADHRRET